MTSSNLNFLAIDTETTGLSISEDRIIQIGFSMFVEGKCVHTESHYLNQEIENKAFDVNGITPAMIAGGSPPYEIFIMLQRVLQKKPRRILIYNAPFDLAFIAMQFQLLELDWDFRPITIIDPLVIWREFHKFRPGRLIDAADHYRVDNPKEHDAGADSATAGHIYCQMYSRYGQLRTTYSNKMFRSWYNDWAYGFMQYLIRKRMAVDPSDFQWPVREELMCSPNLLQINDESQQSLW